jgi:hypothetical protein
VSFQPTTTRCLPTTEPAQNLPAQPQPGKPVSRSSTTSEGRENEKDKEKHCKVRDAENLPNLNPITGALLENMIKVQIGHKITPALLDTGATVNIIKTDLVKEVAKVAIMVKEADGIYIREATLDAMFSASCSTSWTM